MCTFAISMSHPSKCLWYAAEIIPARLTQGSTLKKKKYHASPVLGCKPAAICRQYALSTGFSSFDLFLVVYSKDSLVILWNLVPVSLSLRGKNCLCPFPIHTALDLLVDYLIHLRNIWSFPLPSAARWKKSFESLFLYASVLNLECIRFLQEAPYA